MFKGQVDKCLKTLSNLLFSLAGFALQPAIAVKAATFQTLGVWLKDKSKGLNAMLTDQSVVERL